MRYSYYRDASGFILCRGDEPIFKADHLKDILDVLHTLGVRDAEYRRPGQPSAYDRTSDNVRRVVGTLTEAGWTVVGFRSLDPAHLHVNLTRDRKQFQLNNDSWPKACRMADDHDRRMEALADDAAQEACEKLPVAYTGTTDAF